MTLKESAGDVEVEDIEVQVMLGCSGEVASKHAVLVSIFGSGGVGVIVGISRLVVAERHKSGRTFIKATIALELYTADHLTMKQDSVGVTGVEGDFTQRFVLRGLLGHFGGDGGNEGRAARMGEGFGDVEFLFTGCGLMNDGEGSIVGGEECGRRVDDGGCRGWGSGGRRDRCNSGRRR